MNVPKKLSQKLQVLLRVGVKNAGTFKFPEAIGSIEEQLTLREIRLVEAFLNWLVAEKRSFGWNLPEIYRDFLQSPAADALRAAPLDQEPSPSEVQPIVVTNFREMFK